MRTLHESFCLLSFCSDFELQGVEFSVEINVVGIIPWRTAVGASLESQQPYAWQSPWLLKPADADFKHIRQRLETKFVQPHLESLACKDKVKFLLSVVNLVDKQSFSVDSQDSWEASVKKITAKNPSAYELRGLRNFVLSFLSSIGLHIV